MQNFLDLPLAKPLLLTCENYQEFRAWAELEVLQHTPYLRLLEIRGVARLNIPSAIDCAVEATAEAAQAVWPEWSPNVALADDQDRSNSLTQWERLAHRACERGRAPVVSDLHPTAQIARLSSLLDRERLIYLVPLDPGGTTEAQLQGYSAFVRWLAVNTSARVVAICSAAMVEHPGLEAIRYQALSWSPIAGTQPASPVGEDSEDQEKPGPIYPIMGKPHPGSPGEQALAEVLRRDAELGPLFGFNLPVDSARGNVFIVDLLWNGGKFCVEVDGYQFHSGKGAFARDRQRDFELMLAGFQVLRLTHDEVIGDVHASVEKIRELVRLRQAS